MAQFGRLALHTWTVDTTPLETTLAAARECVDAMRALIAKATASHAASTSG